MWSHQGILCYPGWHTAFIENTVAYWFYLSPFQTYLQHASIYCNTSLDEVLLFYISSQVISSISMALSSIVKSIINYYIHSLYFLQVKAWQLGLYSVFLKTITVWLFRTLLVPHSIYTFSPIFMWKVMGSSRHQGFTFQFHFYCTNSSLEVH